MVWIKIEVTEMEIISGKKNKILNDFRSLYEGLEKPYNLALFSYYDKKNSLLKFYIYLPPEYKLHAKMFLDYYDASPSKRPRKRDMIIEIGNPQIKNIIP